jgi:hypothetical protein
MEQTTQVEVEKEIQIQLQTVAVATEELLFNGKQEVERTLLVQDQQRLVTHSLDGTPRPMEVEPLTHQQQQSHLVQT